MTFTREQMEHMVFTTAVEQGIAYWAQIDSYRWSTGDGATEDLDNYKATITERETGKTFTIDKAVIKRGIRKAQQQPYKGYQRAALDALTFRPDDADFDADTADIIVQHGLLGELVYG